jgi:hypothetical protein
MEQNTPSHDPLAIVVEMLYSTAIGALAPEAGYEPQAGASLSRFE